MSYRVAVVGGGLAGLTAACALAERGARVTVLESRARLGGATFSFERSGMIVDNGQHVLLRCYDRHRAFLDRIGSGELVDVQPRFDIPVGYGNGRTARLGRTPGLPAPLHLSRSLASYGPLSLADRARIVPAALALRFVDPDDPAADGRSFGSWLASRGQRPRAIEALWDLITVAALNTTAGEASLALAARVFRTALLERADAADIGVPSVGLSELHADPAAKYLLERGAEVRTRSAVRAVEPRPGGDFTVRLDDGELDADSVVVAVPPEPASVICPERTFGGVAVEQLGDAPIVNLHAVYSKRVLSERFLAFVDSPVQWVFDRTRVAGRAEGQYLAVSISAAQRWIGEPTASLRDAFVPELERVLPATRHAGLREFFVTRERRATFRQVPGSRSFRPAARTAVPGLALAGSWVDTGWPDTMEGAVRSGERAAAIVGANRESAELQNVA